MERARANWLPLSKIQKYKEFCVPIAEEAPLPFPRWVDMLVAEPPIVKVVR
jgi:hypothetical protein